jgi:hypothetical protein
MDIFVAFLLHRVLENDPDCELFKFLHDFDCSVALIDLVHLFVICIGCRRRWMLLIALVTCAHVAPV